MERTLKRELRLSQSEVEEAVIYWLTNMHDIPSGGPPEFHWDTHGACLAITSEEELKMDLTP